MIALGVIAEGDEVRLRDKDGNVITARAHFDGIDRHQLFVIAFGVRIYFGRRLKSGWVRTSAVEVIAHQPSFEFDEA